MATANVESEILERVANELCGAAETLTFELGVFFSATPPESEQKATAAIARTPEALGIASWALSPLYRAARERMRRSGSDLRAASAMLAVNPDHVTAWNVRKRLLVEDLREKAASDRARDELKFTAVILCRGPKSAETWSHRAWVLRTCGWTAGRAEDELAVGWKAASASACNYYAGVQRGRALAHVTTAALLREGAASRQWLQLHVSDCSGWWHHTRVLQRLLAVADAVDDSDWYGAEDEFARDMYARYGQCYQSVEHYWKWFIAARV
jgi:hypothetical protein